MKQPICPECKQYVSKARRYYLDAFKSALVRHHRKQHPEISDETAEIEITIRLNGSVIEVIPPQAFEVLND